MRPANRQVGLTLLELVVSVAIITAVLVPFAYVMLQSSQAFSALAKQGEVCEGLLKRLREKNLPDVVEES